MLFLGGSTTLHPVGERGLVGDLSGLTVRRLPPVLRGRYAPGAAAAIPDWETRIETIARQAAGQDMRLLAGMPSWMLVLFERVARARELAGRPIRDLVHCWPNLRIFIHGGVSFGPYAGVFAEWLGRPLERLEVYPASEGWVGIQTEARDGLTLTLDHGNFYEFVPVGGSGRGAPAPPHRRRRRAGPALRGGAVHAGRALVVSARRHRALHRARSAAAAHHRPHPALRERVRRERHRRGGGARAGRRLPARGSRGGGVHGGAPLSVDGRAPRQPRLAGGVPACRPASREEFARVLDETLAALNTDYRTKRWRDVGMVAPRVLALPAGTFHRWMREAGKLGDQHKVPRVTNGRDRRRGAARGGARRGGPAPLSAEPAGAR